MPTPPIPTWQTQVGLAKEATWGTYVAPTTLDQFMPVTNPKPSDEIDSVIDTGERGLLGMTQGWYQGFRIGRWSWEQHAFPEPIGHFFMGLLGLDNWAAIRTTADGVTNGTTTVTSATMAFTGADVGKDITGSNIVAHSVIVTVNSGTSVVISIAATGSGTGALNVGGTTSHPITARTSGLPPSYSISDFYGITGTNTRAQAGSYIESLAISGGATGPLKFTVTTVGKGSPGNSLVAKPTAVYTGTAPFLPWQGNITLNSVINLKALQFDLLLKQPIDPILALVGSQDPSAMNAGPLEVTGKLLFAPTDDTEYLLYTTAQQAAFPLSAVFNSGANSLALIMSKVNFEKPSVYERNTPYVKANVSFRAIHNSSDLGPIRVDIVGGKSAAAY